MRRKRLHLEFLRVIAVFMVLFQHSKQYGSLLFLTTNNPFEYTVSLLLEFASQIAVPVFFMISGALLLGKEEDFRTLFRKRILRMAVVLVGVSAGYYVVIALTVPGKSLGLHSIFDFLQTLVHEPVTAPLWFLYAYLAVLLILPLLRKLVTVLSARDYMYLFLLQLLFVPMLCVLQTLVLHTTATAYFRIPLAMEQNVFFLLMGYFLEEKLPKDRFNRKNALCLSAAGFAMILAGALVAHVVLLRDGYTVDNVSPLLERFTCLPAVSLFFCAKMLPFPQKTEKTLCFLGSNVFGVYLLEKGLRELLSPIAERLVPVLTTLPACFVWLLAVFALGQLITAVLRCIPPIRRFL